jgi:hypothetical protein
MVEIGGGWIKSKLDVRSYIGRARGAADRSRRSSGDERYCPSGKVKSVEHGSRFANAPSRSRGP